ncbi:hypothetical protein Y032_0206g1993 [Ancylostoma ceylanicum]|uniref:Uncharacterized protein n=1 Tax=Ancylostoma ceylanicum TaxID=53326 RepID=A0A016SM98_9BILA|nr:hypothetical protein Y032_0206g1993 [Ancylostoma ceylanicum]
MENAKLFQKRKKKTGIPGKRRVQSKCERKKCGLQLFVESPGTTAYETKGLVFGNGPKLCSCDFDVIADVLLHNTAGVEC